MNCRSLFFCLAFLSLSCAPRIYNTPYIELSDTLRLTPGFSTKEVMNFIGEPLFVAMGDAETTVFVYEVRMSKVRSGYNEYRDIVPIKKGRDQQVGDVVHRLALEFQNDKLVSWKPYCNDCPRPTSKNDARRFKIFPAQP